MTSRLRIRNKIRTQTKEKENENEKKKLFKAKCRAELLNRYSSHPTPLPNSYKALQRPIYWN